MAGRLGRSFALPIRACGPIALVTGALLAPSVQAQEAWAEAFSEHFVVVYQQSQATLAAVVQQEAEIAYADLASVFGLRLDGTITVRLFGSVDEYLAAHPLAIEVGGLVAEAHRGRREIGVSAAGNQIGADGQDDAGGADGGAAQNGADGDGSQLRADSPAGSARAGELLANDLRYRLAHLFVYRLSAGRLPAGLQEGVARYVVRPDERRAIGVARLREAWNRDALFDWSELAAPGAAYLDPPVSYPEARSIVHFLSERDGFPQVVRFVRTTAKSSGWRTALENSFHQSAEALESEWRLWLPSYLDGGWRYHALYAEDLAPAEALIEVGKFGDALALLSTTAAMLDREDPVVASRARELMEQAQVAEDALAALGAAQAALTAGAYEAALREAEAASVALAGLGPGAIREAETARELAGRARLGQQAEIDLQRAAALPPWRFAQARMLTASAVRSFARLGNEAQADAARQLLAHLDRRQAPAGWALLSLGVAFLGWNLLRRARDRRSAP